VVGGSGRCWAGDFDFDNDQRFSIFQNISESENCQICFLWINKQIRIKEPLGPVIYFEVGWDSNLVLL
jgi:hypothetical protein